MVDWISLSQTAGTAGDTVVEISASSYSELVERVASFTVKAGTKQQSVTIRQNPEDDFKVSPSSFPNVSSARTYCYIMVSSSKPWAVTSAPDWCSFSPVSAAVGQQIAMVVTGNTGDLRSGFVTFTQSGTNKTKTVSVVQNAANYGIISVSPTTISIPSSGGSKSIYITSDSEWHITLPSWATASVVDGSGNTEVIISAGPNTGDDHNADISISTEYTSAVVSVSQAGNYVIPSVVIITKDLNFDESGDTQVIATVQANAKWYIKAPSWVSFRDGVVYNANAVIDLRASCDYNYFEDRNAVLEVRSYGNDILLGTITITQEGAETTYEGGYITGTKPMETGVYPWGYYEWPSTGNPIDPPRDADFATKAATSFEMRIKYRGKGRDNENPLFGLLYNRETNTNYLAVTKDIIDDSPNFDLYDPLTKNINEYAVDYDLTFGLSDMTVRKVEAVVPNVIASLRFNATGWIYDNINNEYILSANPIVVIISNNVNEVWNGHVLTNALTMKLNPEEILIASIDIKKDDVLGLSAFAAPAVGGIQASLINTKVTEYGGEQVINNHEFAGYGGGTDYVDGVMTFQLSQSTFIVDASGGTFNLTVQSPDDWVVSSKPSWVEVSPTSGTTGSTEFTFTVPAAVSNSRIGNVFFTIDGVLQDWNIYINQEAAYPWIFIHHSDPIFFPMSGGSEVLEVESNTPWTASTYPPTISVSPSSGDSGTTNVTLTVAPSSEAVSGSCTVTSTLDGASVSKTIQVRQMDAAYNIIYTSTDNTVIDVDGSVISNTYENGRGVLLLGSQDVSFSTDDGMERLETLDLSGYTTTIPDGFCMGCSALTTVHNLSSSNIGPDAFYGCESLDDIDLTGVANIYNRAFAACSALTSVTMNNINSIGENAFDSSGLVNVSIGKPSGTTRIYSYAFRGCANLENVIMTSESYSMEYPQVFGACSSLSSITITAQNTPAITANCFEGVATGGTLYTAYEYRSWMSSDRYYLGYYNWSRTGINPSSSTPLYYHVYSSTTFSIGVSSSSTVAMTIDYKINDGEWDTLSLEPGNSQGVRLSGGDYIYFRGDNQVNKYLYLSAFSGEYEVGGNIMSLIDSTGFPTLTTITANETFANFFAFKSNLVSARNLILPATTLSEGCYKNLFYWSDDLTEGPDLPAASVPQEAYAGMFARCSSLSSVKCLATTLESDATRNWMEAVSSTGVFTKSSYMSFWTRDADGIPTGWSVIDA